MTVTIPSEDPTTIIICFFNKSKRCPSNKKIIFPFTFVCGFGFGYNSVFQNKKINVDNHQKIIITASTSFGHLRHTEVNIYI